MNIAKTIVSYPMVKLQLIFYPLDYQVQNTYLQENKGPEQSEQLKAFHVTIDT